MNDEVYVNTEDLQMASLIAFCNALGYDEVFSLEGNLMRFKNPKLRFMGEEYMSVRRAIKLYNNAPNDIWNHISTVNTDFQSFLNSPGGEDMITMLFAGSCRIIDRVKGQFKKGKGFFVPEGRGSHLVSFLTEKDYAQYRHYVGEF